jgi:hypothetical protein
MAPTESVDQSSSASKSIEGDGKPEEAEQETVQKYSADPSVTKMFQYTVSDSDGLSDPAIKEALRGASKPAVVDMSGTFDTYGDTPPM